MVHTPLADRVAEDIAAQYKALGYTVNQRTEETDELRIIDLLVYAPEQISVLGRFLGGLLGKKPYVGISVTDGRAGVSVSTHVGAYRRPGQPKDAHLEELSDVIKSVEGHHPSALDIQRTTYVP